MKNYLVQSLPRFAFILYTYLVFCFQLCKEFSLLKICCTVLWTPKPLLKSDDNTFAALGTSIPCCQDCKWCYFSTKQWSSEGIRGMNFKWQNMSLKLTWGLFSDYVLRILLLQLELRLLLLFATVSRKHQNTSSARFKDLMGKQNVNEFVLPILASTLTGLAFPLWRITE